MSTDFTTAKEVESKWRLDPVHQERLKSALQSVYVGRVLLNVHWSHTLNDKQGVDCFLEFSDCVILAVDFKFRNHRRDDQWITIETISDIAKNRIGWAGHDSKCQEIVFIRVAENNEITDVMRINSTALRELVCTRSDDLHNAGEVRRSSSNGKFGSWQGEFVALTSESLRQLLPNKTKHVSIFGGAYHD